MPVPWWVILAVLLAAVFVLAECNGLIRFRNEVVNARSQMDVHLQRRADLIPNLVATVKGYMLHEGGTLEAVSRAHAALAVPEPEASRARLALESRLEIGLSRLVALAERYPELKADSFCRGLFEELRQTEDLLAASRQYYNDSVMRLENRATTFPGLLFIRLAGLRERPPYFKAEASVSDSLRIVLSGPGSP